MSKKIFAALIVAVVATFAGYNIDQSQKTEKIVSDLVIANVEHWQAILRAVLLSLAPVRVLTE